VIYKNNLCEMCQRKQVYLTCADGIRRCKECAEDQGFWWQFPDLPKLNPEDILEEDDEDEDFFDEFEEDEEEEDCCAHQQNVSSYTSISGMERRLQTQA